LRKPSDLGYDDNGFILPPLNESEHLIESHTLPDGMLFALPAVGLREQREERRRTLTERCEAVASLVGCHNDPALVWCHLNPEGNLLSKLIPDGIEISGSDSDDAKEEKFKAFLSGEARVLITKPKIGAWGLNFQHCAHVVYFPSHSYEQYYQAVRRCWRFGQKRSVKVDIVMTEGDRAVMDNLNRKSIAADNMFSSLVREMNHSLSISRITKFETKEQIPSWL